MPERLSKEEAKYISRIGQAGYSKAEATAIVVLTTRQYSRPVDDLIATLQHYPSLEIGADCRSAIAGLLAKGVLMEEVVDGVTLLGPVVDVRARLASLLSEPEVEADLERLRRVNDDYATVIGPLRDQKTYTTYLEMLGTAQTQVLMPHIMTDPDALGATAVLRERANLGVNIRVLAASVRLAQEFRGATSAAEARRRIDSWKRLASDVPNIQIRVTEAKTDLLFATSVLVDRTLLRLVLHDPFHERSKEGVVVEFGSIDARRLNIIRDFETRFNMAWRRARSPSRVGLAIWVVKSFWQWAIAVLAAVAALGVASTAPNTLGAALGPSVQPVLFNLLISFAATFVVTGGVDVYKRFNEAREVSSDE